MIFSRANLSNLSTSLFIQCCGVVTGVFTARLLGPVARGELATVMLWPMVFSNLGLLGCNWALAREVAADPEKEREWTRAAILIAAGCATLFIMVGYAVIRQVLPHDKLYLLPLAQLCLLLVPLDIFNQMVLAVEQGAMRWSRYNWMRASFFIFYVAGICLIRWHGKAPVSWFVAVFLASQLLSALFRFAMHGKAILAGGFRARGCRILLRRGLPYFCATASNLLSLQLDKIIVISLLNTEAAGLYVVALTFGNAPSSLAEALGMTSFAVVSAEKEVGSQGKIITETFRQSSLISAGLAGVLVCLIPLVTTPLFGAAFAAAVRPAIILTIAASLVTSGSILNQGLRGAGRPYSGIVAQVAAIAVLAASATLLLPGFGLMGMAWAVLLSACSQVAVLVSAAALWLRISPWRFWPFRMRHLRVFFQNVAALRLRYSRMAA
jgi:O-antigen/teichoic acid export membrane protein